MDGQIGFIDFSLINECVTESHSNDNSLAKENKRLLGKGWKMPLRIMPRTIPPLIAAANMYPYSYAILPRPYGISECLSCLGSVIFAVIHPQKDQKSFLEERNRQLEDRLKLRRNDFKYLFFFEITSHQNTVHSPKYRG